MPIGILAKKDDPVNLQSLMDKVKENVKGKNGGSIATFTGIIRGKTLNGRTVERVEYEVFEEAAKKKIEDMSRALALISGVLDVAICHRYGTFLPGEEVLYIVVAAERSEAALETLRLALNRAKHEIPIWKKEHTREGSYWIDIE
ncbi:MAG: molybdenum cofactor biosynthesis protein MoaE [Candidatus Methanomethylicaceae archaeon]